MTDLRISLRGGLIIINTSLCEIAVPADRWGEIEAAVKELRG